MLRVRRLYAVSIPAILLSFHLLYARGVLPYAAVNMLFMLVAPIGCYYPVVFSLILGLAAWILYPVFTYVYKVDPFNAAFPIIVFNGLQLAFAEMRSAVLQNALKWGNAFREEAEKKNALTEEYEKIKAFENGMRLKELEIVNLYEVTKKMSEGLKLDDVYGVFSSFLMENFKFRKCELLVLKWDESRPGLDRRYEVWKEGTLVRTPQPVDTERSRGVDYDKLIRLFTENPREIYLSKDSGEPLFARLHIDGTGVEGFAGVPLLSEKLMVGILIIENLPRCEFEKFVILSMQFALEIKKVLLYEMVERLAITDSLTGLYLRRYFSERLDEEIKRSDRYKLSIAFLMIDIDDFKPCNDTHGHLAGDAILKEMGRIMKESVREIDIVSRYGGEEFAILLHETDAEGAILVAERIRKRVEEYTFKAYDENLKATVSIGVSIYPEDARCAKELIETADTGMYEAKKSGKNVVRRFEK